MNSLLFNNSLGGCDFGIFTSGKGSQGKRLGQFRMAAKNIKFNTYYRRMFKESYYTGERTYVNRENFYLLCLPTIELNGNYTATEEALLSTLVHEMCHYYTYMNGYVPMQGHINKVNDMFADERKKVRERYKEYDGVYLGRYAQWFVAFFFIVGFFGFCMVISMMIAKHNGWW